MQDKSMETLFSVVIGKGNLGYDLVSYTIRQKEI